jgi:hypothetical protein
MADLGASIADLLSTVLGDWNKFGKFLLLLFSIVLLVFGLLYGVLHNLPQATQEIKFGSGSILFSRSTKDGQEFLVVVSPQAWQETGISVAAGDTIKFEAGGKVNIDLAGLNVALQARHEADERILAQEAKSPQWEQEKDTFAPEYHYTAEDKQKITPRWRWSDPNGLAETMQLALPARQKRTVFPEKGYGTLLGAIRETGAQPSHDDVFFIGVSNAIVAKRSGKLYFVVNDVLFNDKDFPDMFFVDNIGSYYVRVTVGK